VLAAAAACVGRQLVAEVGLLPSSPAVVSYAYCTAHVQAASRWFSLYRHVFEECSARTLQLYGVIRELVHACIVSCVHDDLLAAESACARYAHCS
jgi:hypothetical protein